MAGGSSLSFDEPFNGTSFLSGTLGGTGTGTVLFNTGFFASALPNGLPADATLNFTSETANITGAEFDFQSISNPFFNTGTLIYTGTASHSVISMVNQGIIRNTSTTNISLGNFTNDTTGLLDMQTDAGLTLGFINTINLVNLGTIRKSGGTGTSVVTALFTNKAGTIDIQTGKLSFQTTVVYEGGPINVDAGSTLNFGANTNMVVSGTMSSTGSGLVTLSGGFFRGRNSTTGSEGTNPGALDFRARVVFVITSGQILNSNEGLTNIGTINYQGDVSIGTYTNAGTVHTGSGQIGFGGIIDNQSGAIFDFNGDPSVTQTGLFLNEGTIIKSAGSGTVALSQFGASAALRRHRPFERIPAQLKSDIGNAPVAR